jgi:O-antigen ligase
MTQGRAWSAFLTLILLLPLPLGSYSPWVWSLTGLFIAVHILLWAWMMFREGRDPEWRAALWPPILAFTAVVIWILVQQTTLLPVHPIWSLAADALGSPVNASMSMAPQSGLVALIRLLSFGGAFWLSFQYGRDRDRAYQFLRWFAWSSGIYALYGLLNLIAGNDWLLWYRRTSYLKDVTGTFVNRNSYATFAGLGLITTIALLIQTFGRNWRLADPTIPPLPRALQLIKGETAIYLTIAVIVAMAWLQSHSRMGFVATVFGLVALLLLGRSLPTLRGRLIAASLSTIVVVVMLISTSGVGLLNRLGGTEAIDRLPIFRTAARVIATAPLTGQGYGSFASVFPMFRDMTLPNSKFYTLAHDSYIELALEIGIPAAALLTFASLWLASLCLIGAYKRKRDNMIPTLAFAGAVLVGTHALLDFSVQMPAVGCLFAALLGIGNAQAWSLPKPPRSASATSSAVKS